MAAKRKNPLTGQSTPQLQAKGKPTMVPKHRLLSVLGFPDSLRQANTARTGSPDVIEHLGNQLCSSMSFADDLTRDEITKQIHTALEFLVQLSPRNELEAMLAVQAIATHNAAIDCMSRAMNPDRSAAAYDLCLKHAEKLLRIFKEQAELMSRMQRHSPLLAADQSHSEREGEKVSTGAEGEDNSRKIENSDTLCDLRAFLDSKKAS